MGLFELVPPRNHGRRNLWANRSRFSSRRPVEFPGDRVNYRLPIHVYERNRFSRSRLTTFQAHRNRFPLVKNTAHRDLCQIGHARATGRRSPGRYFFGTAGTAIVFSVCIAKNVFENDKSYSVRRSFHLARIPRWYPGSVTRPGGNPEVTRWYTRYSSRTRHVSTYCRRIPLVRIIQFFDYNRNNKTRKSARGPCEPTSFTLLSWLPLRNERIYFIKSIRPFAPFYLRRPYVNRIRVIVARNFNRFY